jgi:hypothetical protein
MIKLSLTLFFLVTASIGQTAYRPPEPCTTKKLPVIRGLSLGMPIEKVEEVVKQSVPKDRTAVILVHGLEGFEGVSALSS